jgi:hypothetical protein
MKFTTYLLALVVLFASCSSHTLIVKSGGSKPLPPGQAKKVTGSQSAKPYAPGQQKKKN